MTQSLGYCIDNFTATQEDEDESIAMTPSAISGLHNILSGIQETAERHYTECVVKLKDEG
ncbi:MAG: hypothetical protein MJK04_00815 [Psychrosphaera sp.]|nr:hypothetical protein [Psychrosphaera sp.]